MAELAQVQAIAVQQAKTLGVPRHSALVRFTHWIHSVSFIVLVLSGLAILLAHPRLYWGETGAREGPSLIDLPLPFVLNIPIRGPGRYLHFLAAWICVLNGSLYFISGFFSRHFRKNLVPNKAGLSWKSLSKHLRLRRPSEEEALSYNVVQRLSYLVVIFLLFPLVIWTGLAMSPAVVSVFPWVVTTFGGQQSARTIHFFVSVLLVLFFGIHIAMVVLAGFWKRTKPMIVAGSSTGKEPS